MSLISFIRSLKPKVSEHYMMLGLLVYALGTMLYVNISNTTIANFVSMIGVLIFYTTLIINCKYSFSGRGVVTLLYYWLVVWCLIITFRSFLLLPISPDAKNVNSVLNTIFIRGAFFPNMILFSVMAFPRDRGFDFSYLVRICVMMTVLYLCIFPFAWDSMTHFKIRNFGTGEGSYQDFISNSTLGISALLCPKICLYIKRYISRIHWIMFMIATVSTLFLYIFMARRGAVVVTIIYLISIWMLNVFYGSRRYKELKLLLGLAVITGIVYLYFENSDSSLFSLMESRGTVDTRSGVEDNFWSDMTETDIWIGRGWFGEYYDKLFSFRRMGIETGYLNIILKGGLLMLIPLISLWIISIYKGFFKSKNYFLKASATVLLISIFSLYPSRIIGMDLSYFVIWFMVYICNTKKWLIASDSEISARLFSQIIKRK